MALYKITYGLGGGFGEHIEVIGADSQKSAERCAYDAARQEYETYEGFHGIRDFAGIMEEENLTEEDAALEYEQEVESWIQYTAEPVEDSCPDCKTKWAECDCIENFDP